jgi:hypothetical protein
MFLYEQISQRESHYTAETRNDFSVVFEKERRGAFVLAPPRCLGKMAGGVRARVGRI